MKKLNLFIIMTLIFTFTSCSRNFKVARINPGTTYIDEAIGILDEPEIRDSSFASKGSTLYIWQDVSLQVNREEIVTAIHRSPANHEKSLQFWKQHYKEINTQFNKVSNGQSNLWQFNIPQKGINVIYDERADIVTKVILYEVK